MQYEIEITKYGNAAYGERIQWKAAIYKRGWHPIGNGFEKHSTTFLVGARGFRTRRQAAYWAEEQVKGKP